MALLEKIKQDIQHYFGSRGDVSKHLPRVEGNLSKPKSIGLFFCIKSGEELGDIRNLIKKIRKQNEKVTAYVFALSREPLDVITDQQVVYFDLSDFTLFGKKKEQLHPIFEKANPQLLISFITEKDTFCLKLISEIKAGFKVGPRGQGIDQIYDLLVDMPENHFNFIDFYEQARHYLSVLNIKTD